jgi:hypothetical protein
MSQWELIKQQYPTKYPLTEAETKHLPFTSKDSFATNSQGEQLLFAKFGTEAIYSRGVGYSWRFQDDNKIIDKSHLQATFIDFGHVENLNVFKGTATFQGKEIKYDKRYNHWVYLNNHTVNFQNPSWSQMPAEEEDTEQVEELLKTTEQTIIVATQKLSLG